MVNFFDVCSAVLVTKYSLKNWLLAYFPLSQLKGGIIALLPLPFSYHTSCESMSASLLDTVAAIFADAQRSLATHRTSTKKLLELLNKPFHDCEESKCVIIDIVLQNCVDRVLVCTKKEPSVERVIKFICDVVIASITNCETPNADSLQISESRSEFDDFFTSSINHLLARTVSSNKVVRLRACEIIAGIMSSMKAETEVSDGIYSNMVKFLIPRLRDKVPGVRMWSIKAIGRLQNPLDDDDLVLSEIIRLMTCDASKDVRVAAVENVCICKRSLPALVERIKDIKSEVRVAALEHMAKDIDIRYVTHISSICSCLTYISLLSSFTTDTLLFQFAQTFNSFHEGIHRSFWT